VEPDDRAHRPAAILALQATTPGARPRSHPLRPHGPCRRSRSSGVRPRDGDRSCVGADSGLVVQLCGDAHLSNFGGFRLSRARHRLWTSTDFDETLPGPFEWDLKRLAAKPRAQAGAATSRPPAPPGRHRRGCRSYRPVHPGVRPDVEPRHSGTRASTPAMIALRWGSEVRRGRFANLERTVTKAKSKDHLKRSPILTHEVDGELRIPERSPLLVPTTSCFSDMGAPTFEEGRSLPRCAPTARPARATAAGSSRPTISSTSPRKVVAFGSVGTPVLGGPPHRAGTRRPRVPQVKTGRSGGHRSRSSPKCRFTNQGQRVARATADAWPPATSCSDGTAASGPDG